MESGINAYIKIKVGNGYFEISVENGTAYVVGISDDHGHRTVHDGSRDQIKLLHKQLGLLLELE